MKQSVHEALTNLALGMNEVYAILINGNQQCLWIAGFGSLLRPSKIAIVIIKYYT